MFQREDNSLCHVKPENDPASLRRATQDRSSFALPSYGRAGSSWIQEDQSPVKFVSLISGEIFNWAGRAEKDKSKLRRQAQGFRLQVMDFSLI